jgi:hypothetical protein
VTGTVRAGRVEERPGRKAWMLRWGGLAGVSVFDQGLLSGLNFLLGVLAARWLPAQAFGAFAVAFAVYLLALGLHSAIVTDPMRVLVWKHEEDRGTYMQSVLRLQIVCSVMAGGVLLAIALAAAAMGSDAWRPLAAMGLVAPALLQMLYLRIRFYVEGRAVHLAGSPGAALLRRLDVLVGGSPDGLVGPGGGCCRILGQPLTSPRSAGGAGTLRSAS